MSRLTSSIRRPQHLTALVALSAFFGLVAHPMVAFADDAPGAPAAAAPAQAAPAGDNAAPAAAPAPAPATNHVEGFRSAHFGMNQAEVRKAIVDDFGKATSIKSSTDDIQKTAVLQITVPEVIQGGGTSMVSYIFGYKSKKLMQVHVAWGHDTDPKLTQQQLYTNGQLLQNFFATAGYQITGSNMVTKDGLIMFRGNDLDGHITVLMLHGVLTEGKTKQQANFNMTGPLTLDYFEDLQKPDIYQLPAGKF